MQQGQRNFVPGEEIPFPPNVGLFGRCHDALQKTSLASSVGHVYIPLSTYFPAAWVPCDDGNKPNTQPRCLFAYCAVVPDVCNCFECVFSVNGSRSLLLVTFIRLDCFHVFTITLRKRLPATEDKDAQLWWGKLHHTGQPLTSLSPKCPLWMYPSQQKTHKKR